MQSAEFDRCIAELVSLFNKNHYPERRIQAFWNGLKHFPDGVFTAAIETFVLSAKNAPLFPEIREACEIALRNRPKPALRIVERECEYCRGNGVVEMLGYVEGRRSSLFASCDSCEAGRSHQEATPPVVPTVRKLSQRGFLLRRGRANIPTVVGMGPGLTALCWSMHKAVLEGRSEPECWVTKLRVLGLTADEAWEAYELEWKTRRPGRINEKCQGRTAVKAIMEMQQVIAQ